MCIRFDAFRRQACRSTARIGSRARIALTVAGLGLAFVPPTSLADEANVGITAENSVLVAKREAKPSRSDRAVPAGLEVEDSLLEPISQIPEHTPELADLASVESAAESGDKFGAALAGKTGQSTLDPQPAKFKGIQPGKSTKTDVLAAWREPATTAATDAGSVLTYKIDPFKSVEIELHGEIVSAINIELQGSLPPKRLAKQLSLDTLEAVAVNDSQGSVLGLAYPERSVLFLFGPPSDVVAATTNPQELEVTHVVIQPLDADAFALRAESRLHGPYQQNIKDLNTALALNPELAHAHWLLAEIYLATGQAESAKSAAEDACDLDPDNAAYQMCKAQTAIALSQYDDATLAVRAVLDRASTPPIVKAQALHAMAQLAALGDAEIAAKSFSFENRAISLADSLATSKNVKERRAAKRLLVEAHLSVARYVASQAYGNKLESISQWVGRASGLAEDLIANDGGSIELRLMIAKNALEALANTKPCKDPGPWVSEAEQVATTLTAECDDDLWRRRIQWELGQVYYQAVRVEHLRLQPAAALRYGQLAIENLADGAAKRESVYDSEQLVGKLYFYIGVVHAVQKQDHKTAAQWYDKALPLLAAPRPNSTLLAPQHDGEELVSMGVTYWQIGEKDHAIDLTLNGAELVAKGVEGGILPKSSLAVPYGNLAAMYEQLGSKEDAAKYSELANSAADVPRPVVASANQRGTSQAQPRPIMSASQQRMQAQAMRRHPIAGQSSQTPIQRTAQRPDTARPR